MQDDAADTRNSTAAEARRDKALKKPSGPPKGGKDAKEARLAEALRANLRRRKASTRKETD